MTYYVFSGTLNLTKLKLKIMQICARTAEISTKVAGGGAGTFVYSPCTIVYELVLI